jgi:S1-C subfamily serine protease
VIQVHGSNLRPARFADSSRVEVGDIVLAIGNPLGLASSVTNGIVSSTNRTVSEGGGIVLPSTMQTSAAINPGNSGGGLAGIDGEIIGIPTLAASDPQLGGAAVGIGFAIPSNTVKHIASQLIANGHVTDPGRAALGIQGADVSTLGSRRPIGVLVRRAAEPASSAGVEPGDIVIAIDGHTTPTLDDLATMLAGRTPGQRVSVKVMRPDQRTRTCHLALGAL